MTVGIIGKGWQCRATIDSPQTTTNSRPCSSTLTASWVNMGCHGLPDSREKFRVKGKMDRAGSCSSSCRNTNVHRAISVGPIPLVSLIANHKTCSNLTRPHNFPLWQFPIIDDVCVCLFVFHVRVSFLPMIVKRRNAAAFAICYGSHY